MTYEDFVVELNKAGLTVRRFADLMGMRPNSISNNKKHGEVPGHLAVIVSLLAEMSIHKINYEPIFVRVGPAKKKPRGVSKTGQLSGIQQGALELSK